MSPSRRTTPHGRRHVDFGQVCIDLADDNGLSVPVEAGDDFVVVTGVSGPARRDGATHPEEFGPGQSGLVVLPGDPYRAVWSGEDRRASVVRIDADLVADVAEGMTGSRDVAITGRRPATHAAQRRWNETVEYVVASVASCDGREVSDLLVGEASRLLGAVILATFPNTAAPTVSESPSTESTGRRAEGETGTVTAVTAVTTVTLSGAVEFIAEHADLPLTIVDIAAAVRVTPRALQLAFRRHLATTPMAHLRQVRLARVHAELVSTAPDDGVTVTDIAGRWGFGGSSRFPAYYRDAFGASPHETLAS